jgi:hypothetical protein
MENVCLSKDSRSHPAPIKLPGSQGLARGYRMTLLQESIIYLLAASAWDSAPYWATCAPES